MDGHVPYSIYLLDLYLLKIDKKLIKDADNIFKVFSMTRNTIVRVYLPLLDLILSSRKCLVSMEDLLSFRPSLMGKGKVIISRIMKTEVGILKS